MKEFNLTKALNREPVVTRDGHKAIVVCKTRDKILVHVYSHISSVFDTDLKCNLDGTQYSKNSESMYDLFMTA